VAGLFRPGDTNGGRRSSRWSRWRSRLSAENGIKPALIQARGDAGTVCDQVLAKLESQGNIRYAFALPINKAFRGEWEVSGMGRSALDRGVGVSLRRCGY